jgi:hypothetical protein
MPWKEPERGNGDVPVKGGGLRKIRLGIFANSRERALARLTPRQRRIVLRQEKKEQKGKK